MKKLIKKHVLKKNRLATPAEVENEIRTNFNLKNAPGFDLITEIIPKELPRREIIELTYILF